MTERGVLVMTVALPEMLQDAEVTDSIWKSICVSLCVNECVQKKWQQSC